MRAYLTIPIKQLLFIGVSWIILLGNSRVHGQQSKYLFLELGGSGGLGSLNLEVPIKSFPNFHLSGRAGFSLAPIDRNNGTALVFPLMVHGNWGKNGHFLDMGIGQTFSATTRGNIFIRMPASLGYRLSRPDRKFLFRVAYTPIISYLVNFQWEHWAGISFGYKFIRK